MNTTHNQQTEQGAKAPEPRYTYSQVEQIYDRMSKRYSSHNADRKDLRKQAIRYLMECLNNDPGLKVKTIGLKLEELINTTDPRYRSPLNNQVMDRFWEKQYRMMIQRVRYTREELDYVR